MEGAVHLERVAYEALRNHSVPGRVQQSRLVAELAISELRDQYGLDDETARAVVKKVQMEELGE